jgi:hypothetical protein
MKTWSEIRRGWYVRVWVCVGVLEEEVVDDRRDGGWSVTPGEMKT